MEYLLRTDPLKILSYNVLPPFLRAVFPSKIKKISLIFPPVQLA